MDEDRMVHNETHLSGGRNQQSVGFPVGSHLAVTGDEALKEVVYRAIFGALLILIFANVKIKDKSEL